MFSQIFPLLAVLGLTSAAVIKRDDELNFEIEFKDDAGYMPCNVDWEDAPGKLIDRSHQKIEFHWDGKDIGTERAKAFFKLYVYEDPSDADNQPLKTFKCTLQALETSSITHGYTLEGDGDYFDSLLSHKQAHLWCNQEGGQDPKHPKIDSNTAFADALFA